MKPQSTALFLECPRLTASGDCTAGLRWLLVVYFGAIGASAVLAPAAFLGLRAVWEVSPESLPSWLSPLTSRLDDADFPRWFDRLRWLPVLLLLPWLMRMTGLASWQRLGFSRPVDTARRAGEVSTQGGFSSSGCAAALGVLGKAFAVGVLLFLPVALLQEVAFGAAVRGGALAVLPVRVLGAALLSGVLIALLEETVFRGLLLRVFGQAMRPWAAVVASALFFAMVHFKAVPWPEGQPVEWWSGLSVAWGILVAPVTEMQPLKFLNLLAAGVVLNLVFIRWRSLWPCIGLHAGWVFYRVIHREVMPMPPEVSPWLGGPALLDGASTLLILAVVIAWLSVRSGLPVPYRQPPLPITEEARLIWRDVRRLVENTFTVLRNTWRVAVIIAGLAVPVLFLLAWLEKPWMAALSQEPGSVGRAVAGWLSRWGDFYRLNLLLLVGGLVLAWWNRSAALRRGVLAVFLAALLAGIAVNVLRPTLGRPRPSANLPDGFYGPSLSHDFHGFPSGHATTAFATASAVAVLAPPYAIPAFLGATAVAGSRIALDRHHPTDSLAGAALGCWLGLAAGYGGRRRDYVRLEPHRWGHL